ncbi:MAG: DUF3667 domain-containing protein [Chryseobacterium jejuense]|uniref:DUF3667 domain-containing protein n=1 Tax=Chryseobacterium jejuense TaxID=445960 RepID=UPI003D0AF1F1
MHDTCLNCSQPIATKYCGNCGQKTSTHRYSLKHFIEHDFIHGVWHVDKGVLFTIKELFTRPGNSVREYILGKRVNYFSFVTLLLLTATISTLLSHYSGMDYSVLVSDNAKAMMNSLQELMMSYFKIYLLLTIPFMAIFSYLWFKKAGFNYSEHLVLNSYKTAADMIALVMLTFIILFFKNSAIVMNIYTMAYMTFSLIYGVWFYYQFFSQVGYSKTSLFFRSLMIPVSFMVFQTIVGLVWGIVALILKS